jgi:hypothetical protein
VTEFVRFQSAVPNRRGAFPGVFALANGLARDHRLTPEDAAWLRASNDRANTDYPDPSSIVADCYDPVANLGARAWFRASATELLELTGAYLDLLDRYGVPWVELRTHTPGRITYEDDVQVVAVPLSHDALSPPAVTLGTGSSCES